MIYLDNAATSYPKPPSVIAAVNKALRNYSANPGRSGHAPSVRAAKAVYNARANIAGFFNMKNEENVIFTPNCTAALNTVIKGVLKKGDHVIISSLEHNSVLRPIDKLSRQGIISYSVAGVGGNDEITLNEFRNAINSRTRMMICTHASNVFGSVLPVRRLCALAHSYGLLFCLDAAQSAGVLNIDMASDNYDFVCCAGHKGLYGPMGTGLLLINSAVLPDTLVEGGTGSASAERNMPEYTPDRYESGTVNLPGIIGLSAGVDFVRKTGVDRIYSAEMSHISYLYEGLSKTKGIILPSEYPEQGRSAPVMSFQVKGADSETAAAFLDKHGGIAVRAGLHCAPLAHRYMKTDAGGTVRLSPSYFTTRNDVQSALYSIQKFVHNMQ